VSRAGTSVVTDIHEPDDHENDVAESEPATSVEPTQDPGPPLPREPAWRRVLDYRHEMAQWLTALASAAVYATLIVTFVAQVARVEGVSMAPTLADHDQRGDVVMLYYPENPDLTFVKRVIGEPGDWIRIVNGRVFVNDVALHDDFVLPEFRSHDDFGPVMVPQGYYFVMGDHRNNSSDSREWGPVPKKYILGRVQLRWWPLRTAHVF